MIRLLKYPGGIIELERVPVLHIIITDSPVSVFNLEWEIRREHRAHGSNSSRDLAHFEDHFTHIHGQIITSRVGPTIRRRIEQLKSVDSVVQAEISIVQRRRRCKSINRSDNSSTCSNSLIDLVGRLLGIAISTSDQRHQRTASSANLDRQRESSSGSTSSQLGGCDGISGGGHFSTGSSRNNTTVRIDLNSSGERRSDLEIEVVLGVRIHFSHLDILENGSGFISKIRNRHCCIYRIQIQGIKLPIT